MKLKHDKTAFKLCRFQLQAAPLHLGGVEFNTTFTVECGQWADTDDALDYRLAYWYNLDAFNARWTWLTDTQAGVSTFERVLLPHDTSNGGDTKVRLLLFVGVTVICPRRCNIV